VVEINSAGARGESFYLSTMWAKSQKIGQRSLTFLTVLLELYLLLIMSYKTQ